jgi:hypothetical protein
MKLRADHRRESVVKIIGPMADDARTSSFIGGKGPSIQPVNLAVEINVKHFNPRKRIFAHVLLKDAIDGFTFAQIIEASRLID